MFANGGDAATRVRVKICGITNATDALAAIECGADALGFNFWPGSKRYLDIEKARDWIEKLPGAIFKVAVLVDPTLSDALEVSRMPFINALQLHGKESPEFCRKLAGEGVQFAKAVPVGAGEPIVDLPSFSTDMLVLDSMSAAGFGGTGVTFPWELARDFGSEHPTIRIILAGGLTPENVNEAISQVHPFGVDVTTGVEASPGRKNIALLRAFVESVRRSVAS
jgi:phosphoribosylanthranilate isomerase